MKIFGIDCTAFHDPPYQKIDDMYLIEVSKKRLLSRIKNRPILFIIKIFYNITKTHTYIILKMRI